MAIIKATPQFSIWCDECDEFEDFTAFDTRRAAVKHFRSLGWVIGKKVLCPTCTRLTKRQPDAEKFGV